MSEYQAVVTIAQKVTSQLGSLGIVKSKSEKRRGVSIPLRSTSAGRLATSIGESLDIERISTALTDGDNENPFRQDRTMGSSMIFDAGSPAVRARIMSRLRVVFAEFERQQRYRLLAESIEWEQTGPELILTFKYHNLEADEIKPFSQKFGG